MSALEAGISASADGRYAQRIRFAIRIHVAASAETAARTEAIAVAQVFSAIAILRAARATQPRILPSLAEAVEQRVAIAVE